MIPDETKHRTDLQDDTKITIRPRWTDRQNPRRARKASNRHSNEKNRVDFERKLNQHIVCMNVTAISQESSGAFPEQSLRIVRVHE